MCGRLYQTLPLARLLKIANSNATVNQDQYTSSFNVCPSSYIPAIKPSKLYMQMQKDIEVDDEQLNKQENREVQFMSWGHKTNLNFLVNGRIEQLLNKKIFLNFIENRCVVVMEGYYQWNQKKEPFSFRPKGTDHFLVAALYSDNKQIIILTKDATPELAAVHHRMPVILSHEDVNLWLNPKNTKIIQQVIQNQLLKKQKQVWKNVGFAKLAPYVGQVKQKSSKCLMSIQQYKKQLDKAGLMRFWKKPPIVEGVSKDGQIIRSIQSEAKKNSQRLNEFNSSNRQTQKRDFRINDEQNCQNIGQQIQQLEV